MNKDKTVKKHAFLILAHKNMNQVGELLSALDHSRSDFYILIDLKCKEDINVLKNFVKKGKIFFVKRISASWGGDSLIRAELILIEAASKNYHYQFYHFLSGQDFPLKSINEILSFYDMNSGKEFISIDNNPELIIDRVKYYYPFQNILARKKVLGILLRKISRAIQKLFRINRIDTNIIYGVGSQWFDITDDFARYVLSQKKFLKKHFKNGFCVDEIFLQTLFLNSNNLFNRYHADRNQKHPFIQDTYFDVCRAIDWTRGTPYTYTVEDIPMLIDTGCMFARKFDFQRDPTLKRELKRIMNLN